MAPPPPQRSDPVPSSPHVSRGATALPTRRQLRKLSREAEKKLHEERLPRTATDMFVSMMAVLIAVSCFPLGVQADSFTYWAYVPNPPLLTPVTWNDDPPLLYISKS